MIGLLKRATELGWKIEIDYHLVVARRVAVGGKCGVASEFDRSGAALDAGDLERSLTALLTKLVQASSPKPRQHRSPEAVKRRLRGAQYPAAFVDATVSAAARDIKKARKQPGAAARLEREESQVRGLNAKGLLK